MDSLKRNTVRHGCDEKYLCLFSLHVADLAANYLEQIYCQHYASCHFIELLFYFISTQSQPRLLKCWK